jgi:dTDP-4-dehydrorhamnose reductase
MKTLVLGASGQLGQCLKKAAADQHIETIYFPAEGEANILDKDLIIDLFARHQPEFVINCAAYTAVDKAEDDIELCRSVNKTGASNIADVCKTFGTALIHVSTDFVFEGNGHELLREEDNAHPVNIYGVTKLEGEQDIIANLSKYFILRTSWLYSEYGNNFVKAMLRFGAERDELNVIADQIGTPTYAIDLAEVILHIIGSGSTKYGIYHYSNEGVTSWYDFAMGIFDISDTKVSVNPIPTSQYSTRAVRPKFSVMDKSKIKATFGIQIPYWRKSLERCMAALNGAEFQ